MKRFIMVLILVLLLLPFVNADVYVKNMKRSAAFELMGTNHPEKVEIEEQWLGKDRFTVINKDLTIIADFEKNKLFLVVPKIKKYFQFPSDIDKEKLRTLVPAKVADIITSIKVTDVKASINGPEKKVSNWNCYGCDLEFVFMIPALNIMPKMKMHMWLTEDIPFDHKKYTGGLGEFFGKIVLGVLNVDESAKKEFEKLDQAEGFAVANEVTVSIFGTEIRAESQCMELAEKPAPKGIYAVPAGYTEGTIGPPQSNR